MEDNKLTKRYGLITAICMVVGTVIGSGVFFKAREVLVNNNGNMLMCLLTVIAVGMIMLVCSYSFSLLAARVEKVNGIVDYSELALGKRYAYLVGWFMTVIFNPILTSCLAWISANYTLQLIGVTDAHWSLNFVLTLIYLVLSFLLNVFSPSIAGKFQVSTTFIKLVPLAVMSVVGIIMGLVSGNYSLNSDVTHSMGGENSGIFGAIVSFAFAFEGWIFATCINSELRDAKKNLPRALVIGSLIIICVYLGYFAGVFGVMPIKDIVSSENLPKDAFSALFGSPVMGTVVYVFVVISCLGTMNGLMLASCRGLYSLAVRNEGPAPEYLSHVNKRLGMPVRSSVIGFIITVVWLLQWQLGFINGWLPGFLSFENDELPIITFYALCIPIFIYIMVKCDDLGVIKRFVIPSLASLACLFMIFAAVYKYRWDALYYLIVFAVIMAVGAFFSENKKRSE